MRARGRQRIRLLCGPAWAAPRQVGAYQLRVLVWRLGAGWRGARGALAVGLTVPLAVWLEGPPGRRWWPVVDVRWLVGGLVLAAAGRWGWRRLAG